MSNINRVELSGNLTRDPELRVTKGGTSVLRFGIAVGERGGDGKEHTNFFDCTIFGKYAEVMRQYLGKGQKVAVAGSLHYSAWTDQQSGKTRSRVEVYVRELDTMGPPPARDATEYASGQQMPIAAAPPHAPAEVYDEDIPF